MSEIIQTFLLAMTPIGELRAALPVAITVFKMHWALAYCVAVLGNLVPVVFLLLFLGPVSAFLSRHFKIFEYFFDWLFKRTRQKVGDKIRKHGWLALIPFVAIPLPITGAWTGTVIAFLFKIPFRKAFPVITSGVLLAGIIVAIATGAGFAIEQYFGWQTLIIILLVIILIQAMFRHRMPKHITFLHDRDEMLWRKNS